MIPAINQDQQVTQTPSINQIPPKGNKSKKLLALLLAVGIILVILFTIGFLYFKNSYNANNIKEKRIITLKSNAFIILPVPPIPLVINIAYEFLSYDLASNKQTSFFKPPIYRIVNEAKISRDGKKLYYTFYSPILNKGSGTVVIVSQDKSTKEINIANGDSWYLSHSRNITGIFSGGTPNDDCYWSPDSAKLACILDEFEGGYSSSGRDRITIYDTVSENVNTVLTSDQIIPPKKGRDSILLAGWLNNNLLLIIRPENNPGGPRIPEDFYSLDINTKDLNKEFSYNFMFYDNRLVFEYPQIFFISSSSGGDDKLVKFDLETKEDTVIFSNKHTYLNGLYISEENTKLFYNVAIPPGYTKRNIHIYDLQTGLENVFQLRLNHSTIEGLLRDGKTHIINYQNKVLIYNSETKATEDLGKVGFIGLGYF